MLTILNTFQILSVIEFAGCLPVFQTLTQNDQALLLRTNAPSCIQYILAKYIAAMDPADQGSILQNPLTQLTML